LAYQGSFDQWSTNRYRSTGINTHPQENGIDEQPSFDHPWAPTGSEMVRRTTMTHLNTSRLKATATMITLSGLILAMGAPVKWAICIPWPF
jgi:hypothetical protein